MNPLAFPDTPEVLFPLFLFPLFSRRPFNEPIT